MIHKRRFALIFFLPLVVCASCLHSRSGASGIARSASITIALGRAVVKIRGEVTEDLYAHNAYTRNAGDHDEETYYTTPVIPERTITKNETLYMSTGEEYRLSILPTEVVTVNIISLDSNDVTVTVHQYGRDEKHTVTGSDTLGLFLAFQNR